MTDFYVDNVAGSDSNNGTSWTLAWKTLAKASLNASYGGASKPWHIYIKNNGWGNPYLETSQNYLISPDFSGTDANNRIYWHCDYAPMLPAAEITGLTWTRLTGTANVYYCSNTTDVSKGLYGWGRTTDDIMLTDGFQYFARRMEPFTRIPNDWEDHCYFHDTANNLLYLCDRSGNPAISGVRLAAISKLGCFYTYQGSTVRTYHFVYNPHFYGGDVTISKFIVNQLGVGTSYLEMERGYLLYGSNASGSGSAMLIANNANQFRYLVLIGGYGSLTYGAVRVTATATAPKFYNCTILPRYNSSGYNYAFYLADGGRVEVKNCAIIDAYGVFNKVGTATITECNNLIGQSPWSSTKETLLNFIPESTDRWSEGSSSNYSLMDARIRDLVQQDLRLVRGSVGINAGANLSMNGDVVGNPVPFGAACDMGAYELQGIEFLFSQFNKRMVKRYKFNRSMVF